MDALSATKRRIVAVTVTRSPTSMETPAKMLNVPFNSADAIRFRNSFASGDVVEKTERSGVMADDKTKVGKQDRDRVARGEDYKVQHLARETGLSPDQARILIKAYGNDREKLMKAAKMLATAKPRVRSSRI
jgi:hypothetical protein